MEEISGFPEKDRHLLIELLAEYSIKLRSLFELWFKLYQQSSLLFYIAFFVLVAISTSLFTIMAFSPGSERSGDRAIVLLSATLFFMTLPPLVYLGLLRRRRMNVARDEIKTLATQLEELVRKASQIEEHAELSFVHRAGLRLRLADAEGALNCTRFIVGDRSTFKQKYAITEDETQSTQDTVLQRYLDQMELLLDKGLRASPEDEEVRVLARARTLAILGRLGSSLKRHVLQFLYEAKLINREQPVVVLTDADLSDIDLSGADLSGADLHATNLSAANLRGTNLREANLQEANLQGASLQEASLRRANLRVANLRRADLRDSFLPEANLQRASLPEANLQGAYLPKANLQGAYLREANLQGANLQGANLQGARGLTQEQIEWTTGLSETVLPEGLKRPQLWSKSIEEQKKTVQERFLRGL